MRLKIRLNKFISSNSEFSRRKADELIQNGKVFINNKKVQTLGTQIDPDKDKIEINGKIINHKSEKIYLALNKPADHITTRSDDFNRKTVMDLVPKIPNLKPVGRLDKDTEGLLLFSNDGEFINKYTHPKYECEKEYFGKISGLISDEKISKLENGIIIDNKKTSKAKIKIIKRSKIQTTLTITIHEGRNRQIRKMFASLGNDVKYLQRMRIGKISLGPLKKGQYRKLTTQEINAN
ncbi:MAG: pseudouridine synthase [Nitrospirota bacterium]